MLSIAYAVLSMSYVHVLKEYRKCVKRNCLNLFATFESASWKLQSDAIS